MRSDIDYDEHDVLGPFSGFKVIEGVLFLAVRATDLKYVVGLCDSFESTVQKDVLFVNPLLAVGFHRGGKIQSRVRFTFQYHVKTWCTNSKSILNTFYNTLHHDFGSV